MNKEEQDFFDSVAPRWDDMEINSVPDKINRLLDIIGVGRGTNILDLGTGTGVLIPWLLERTGPEGRVTAVDASEGMLRMAMEKYAGAIGSLQFLKMDFEEEEIEGRYDLIMLYCVYPHLTAPLVTLRRLVDRNLNDVGRIIVAFPTDERFVNAIHEEKQVDSLALPPASCLAQNLRDEGFAAWCLLEGPEGYIVEIKR